jgi:type VI secretion system protein ImpL
MSHWQHLRSAIGMSFVLSFYAIACLLVYYGGPALGLSLNFRLALIGLILLTWPFALLINHYRKKRQAAKEESQQSADSSSDSSTRTSARSFDHLTRGAEETVQWLRNSKLGAARRGDAAYTLPWFLIAGPPASGKTSFALSSGLDFHTLPSQRHADRNRVSPTRDCEWRVTDHAVFLDTAGRYDTEGADEDEWIALIETVRKHRKTRPLDGVVLAVNAARTLSLAEAEIEQQAKLLRGRLEEVIRRSQCRFPVYLVFTHIDLIEGFEEFFSPFGRDERAQVWGATIPLEKSANAHALFDVEFDHLYEALIRRRLARLGVPASPGEQLCVLDFPLHFAETRRKLGAFASALFRPNPFTENPLLRGFYFTSSAADEEIVSGQSFFVERLFKDVVLRDKDLAASFQLGKRNPHRVRDLLVGAGIALLFLISIGMVVSFIGNRWLLAEARERGRRVDEIIRAYSAKDPNKKDAAARRVELEALDDLRRTLATLDDYDQNSPPLYLRFGFYSGDEINPYLRAAYFDSISHNFFEPAAAALEQDLKTLASAQETDGQSDLGHHYDLLKTYLMLSSPDKVESAFLANQLTDYWKKSSPPEIELVSEEQLKFYARQAGRPDAPAYRPDDKTVADSRRKLAAYPAVNRFFKQITSQIDTKVAPMTLEAIAQDRGRGALTSSYSVPGSFTLAGYREHWGEAMESAAEEIGKDDWVMGPQAASQDQSADISKLQAMYFREYTSQWQRFIKGVNVRPFRTKDDAVETLKALSATDSPLELVMTELERNTNLSSQKGGGGIWGWIKGIFASSKESVAGTTEAEKEYRPVFAFVSSEDKKISAPMSQYRAALRRVLDALENKSDDQLAQTAKALLTGKDEIGLQKAEQDVSRLTDSFKTAASSDVARLLRQPLSNLRAMLYGGGYEQIEKGWREQIYPKARALESAFPFTDSSSQAPVLDLARFLNPTNGQLTAFFNDKLATSFDDAQGQWKLKEAGAVKLSDGFVAYLNAARALRDALFAGGGQQPEVSYDLTLMPQPGTDLVIEIDGNRVETRGASPQSAKFNWPARAGTSGARIVVARGGQQSEKSFPGEWGLFQMFAAGSPSKTADNQYQLSWMVGTTQVRATLRPSSAISPFERKLFTSMRVPQSPN